MKFGGRSWNDEEIIGAACEWFHRYGTSPTATDWNPAMLRAKNGSPEALERYLDGEWPSTATVLRKFDGRWTGWQLIGSYRERARMPSHADLARRAGLSWATVRNLEQGRSPNPTPAGACAAASIA